MSSAIPKLKNALARQALIHFFNNSYWSREELEYLNGFCSMHNTDKVLKLKTRLLTEENNDMLVASVLADATPDEFKFLHDKYRLGHTFTKISMEVHVHPNALQRWRDKFLEDLGDLMEYKLPDSDIFSRNKVEALVVVLERTLAFYAAHGNAAPEVIRSLKNKLNVYQNLLFAIKFFLLTDSQKLAYRAIKLKIMNQQAAMSELEYLTGASHTTILHYLHLFRQQFFSE